MPTCIQDVARRLSALEHRIEVAHVVALEHLLVKASIRACRSLSLLRLRSKGGNLLCNSQGSSDVYRSTSPLHIFSMACCCVGAHVACWLKMQCAGLAHQQALELPVPGPHIQ